MEPCSQASLETRLHHCRLSTNLASCNNTSSCLPASTLVSLVPNAWLHYMSDTFSKRGLILPSIQWCLQTTYHVLVYLWWQRVAIHFSLYIHISYWYCLDNTTAIVQYGYIFWSPNSQYCWPCDVHYVWSGLDRLVYYHLSDLIHPIRSQEMNIIVILVPDTSQSSLSYYWFIGSTPFVHWLHPFRNRMW